jgi:hypothetical protein
MLDDAAHSLPEAMSVRAIYVSPTPAIGEPSFDIVGETPVALRRGER